MIGINGPNPIYASALLVIKNNDMINIFLNLKKLFLK